MSTSSPSSSGLPAGTGSGSDAPRQAVLVVADPARTAELVTAFDEPLPYGAVEVLTSTGGDDTIDLFEARHPRVVIVTASLEDGDAKSLIEALRDMVSRDQVAIVLVGDDTGPVRTALDAIDIKPDRFISRPLAAKALRFAVQGGFENVARALGEPTTPVGAAAASSMAAAGAAFGAPGESPRVTQPFVSRSGTSASGAPGSGVSSAESVRMVASTEAAHAAAASAGATFPGTGIRPLELVADDAVHIHPNDIDEAPPRANGTGAGVDAASAGPAVARASTDRGLGLSKTPAGAPPASSPSAHAPSLALRARWESLADSIATDDLDDLDDLAGNGADDDVLADAAALAADLIDDDRRPPAGTKADDADGDGALPLPPVEIKPRKLRATDGAPETSDAAIWRPDSTSAMPPDDAPVAPPREPTLIIADAPPPGGQGAPAAGRADGTGIVREPTVIIDDAPATGEMPVDAGSSRMSTVDPPSSVTTPLPSLASRERWSQPVMLAELIDRSRDSSRELLANIKEDMLGVRGIDDDMVVAQPRSAPPPHAIRSGQLDALEDMMEPVAPADIGSSSHTSPRGLGFDYGGTGPGTGPGPAPAAAATPGAPADADAPAPSGTSPGFTSGVLEPDAPPSDRLGTGRDFARQLRAKMSQMAQRLFQSDSPAQPPVPMDVRPRHDHHTEIDLASLGEETALADRGVTEIESRGAVPVEPRPAQTSPGTWDTHVRERGLPDAGEIVRGVSDVPMILAKMFAQQFTGRVGIRRDAVEKVVYLDAGRPVFASSNEPGDRMGELLVREGKITASQYERCQVHVEQSGRRIGEILVDFGYLKRRELLPAVRRHVEDIIYSLFGWDAGHYQMTADPTASSERIRLSRHPASLVLEGIRRKLDRSTLDRLIGPASTVIEVPDRERLGGITACGTRRR